MTCCRVAVKIDAARRFQHSPQFDEARGHHDEVGHHVGRAEHLAHRFDEACESFGRFGDKLLIGRLRFVRPVPSVLERHYLRRRLLAARFTKQNVIVCRRVERRV